MTPSDYANSLGSSPGSVWPAKFLGAALLVCGMAGPAAAAPLYGAQFALNASDGVLESHGSVAGTVTAGAATSQGDAPLGGPDIQASISTYSLTASADATALYFDQLTFHVEGGGTATVQAELTGSYLWTGAGGVKWILNLQTAVYQGASGYFTGSTPEFNSLTGRYDFVTPWEVTDGLTYGIYTTLYADGFSNGSTAYIDDPLSFSLPAGVTFEAASGNSYAAVPLPASFGLFGSGLLAAGLRRRRRTAAT